MNREIELSVSAVKTQLEKNPIIAIDQILKLIIDSNKSQIKLPKTTILNLYCQAILQTKFPKTIFTEPLDQIFGKDLAYDVRRFSSICLLRLLSTDDSYFKEMPFRAKAYEMFDETLLDGVYAHLGVEKKSQTFEKESKLKSIIPQIESDFENLISSVNNLNGIKTIRKEFMHRVHAAMFKIFVSPFLPIELLDVQADQIFTAIEDYLTADTVNCVAAYQKAEDIIEDYIDSLNACGTTYCNEYMVKLFQKLLKLIGQHIENNPSTKPAMLIGKQSEKKYPLNNDGLYFNLSFIIENVQTGWAFGTIINVEALDEILIEKQEFYLGNFEPNSRIILEIPAKVNHNTKSVFVEMKIKWTNFDKSVANSGNLFELQGQDTGINWVDLTKEEPYSLEPVETEDELIGRTEIIQQLTAKAQAKSIGSSYVTGQKRVGKTSVVKTLKTTLTKMYSSEYLVLYFERGDYINPDPTKTVTTLGRRMCETIKKSDKRFSNVPIPEFTDAISPLSEYLDSILDVAPNYRILFILDEFDELPLELYKKGPIGDAFFGTIRTISGKPPFGFILTGSENMEHIMNTEGSDLNKFQATKLDYFDKDQHWNDFETLVRKPVEKILEISDGGLEALYEQTAGNPFFTKLICSRLFIMMVNRRDRHVTRQEVLEAVKQVLNRDLAGNKFSHFWMDGILEVGSKFEEISIRRRKLLLSFAETYRKYGSAEKSNILKLSQESYGIPVELIENELREFQRRQVLVAKKDVFDCKVPLFRSWLIERGVDEIITSFTDIDGILEQKKREEEIRVKPEEIVSLIAEWTPYKGRILTEDKIRVWLNQFGDNSSQRPMFEILKHVKFYSGDEIRSKMKEAHGIVNRGLVRYIEEGKRKRSDILVSYLDGPGKSGSYYAKLYAEENDILFTNIVEYAKISQSLQQNQELKAIVFIDDFVGSGKSVTDYVVGFSKEHGEAFINSKIPGFFVAISGFQNASSKIEATIDKLGLNIKLHICDPLDESSRAFSEKSAIFSDEASRLTAKSICFKYGSELVKNNPLGYGDSQATVVFENSCPNNTLPILWAQSKNWIPLFKRL